MNDLGHVISEAFTKLNSFGSVKEKEELVVWAFSTDHRTLQQSFVRSIILPILRHLGNCYNNGAYDDRNEASCRLAAKILAALSEDDTYLPYI